MSSILPSLETPSIKEERDIRYSLVSYAYITTLLLFTFLMSELATFANIKGCRRAPEIDESAYMNVSGCMFYAPWSCI